MEQSGTNLIASLLPLLLLSVVFAIGAHFLAKDKGRNVGLWTVLGAIPLVNMFCIWYFIGAANLRLEKKIDDLTEMLHKRERGETK
ncbi:MAG: hypothetical protein Q8M34_06640 [Thermodesulfovibrionales bacterium]|nr:hypothetical protein [Thermodesulfovibrionales bacterium]